MKILILAFLSIFSTLTINAQKILNITGVRQYPFRSDKVIGYIFDYKLKYYFLGVDLIERGGGYSEDIGGTFRNIIYYEI